MHTVVSLPYLSRDAMCLEDINNAAGSHALLSKKVMLNHNFSLVFVLPNYVNWFWFWNIIFTVNEIIDINLLSIKYQYNKSQHCIVD